MQKRGRGLNTNTPGGTNEVRRRSKIRPEAKEHRRLRFSILHSAASAARTCPESFRLRLCWDVGGTHYPVPACGYGESILSNERIAWVSTANRSLQGRGGEKGDDAKGTDGEQGKGGSQTKSDGKSGKVATVAPA